MPDSKPSLQQKEILMDIQLKILRSKYYPAFGSTVFIQTSKKMYSWYGKKDDVQNVHLPANKHDFGITKRMPQRIHGKVFKFKYQGHSK
ncbi:MAG: hypothetical protein IPO01_15530 [Chitinophagaceae bacterium]|nr:hypothetical protein [Chitinophagaceae bacterium]